MAIEQQGHKESTSAEPTRREFLKTGAKYGATAVVSVAIWEGAHRLMNREKEFYDLHDMEAHLDGSLVEWQPAGQVLNTKKKPCMDDREDQCSCCEPGGNAGGTVKEFAAVEEVTGRRFSDEQIGAAIDRKIQLNPHAEFYQHTDAHAIGHVAHAMHITPQQVMELLRDPGDRREDLIEALLDAPGCGHMKGLIQQSGSYRGVRPELPRAVSRHFYNRLLSPDPQVSSKMYHRVLPGGHGAKAALILDGEGDETDLTALIQPYSRGSAIFAVDKKMMRMGNRRFAMAASDILRVPSREIDQRQLLDTMNAMEDHHLEASRQALAPHHPVFLGTIDSRQRKIHLSEA